MPAGPAGLARALVNINSPTGEEGAVGEYLAAHLGRLGYDVQRQQVAPGRFNVFATRARPVVVLSTHMDTVPPSLPVHEDDTHLYGRGSADGARAAGTLEPKGRCLINGEPTENRMARGHKGMLRVELRASGRAAHSAYPEEGDSAIEPVLDALERVRRLPLPTDPTLGDCTLNIGTIAGGIRPNVIPDACRAELLFRTVGENGALLAAVQAAAGERLEVVVAHDAPPVKLRVLPGFESTLVRFGTDVPWLKAWGERFLMGPGSITVAHTDHERVAKRELEEAVERYERAVTVLLDEAGLSSVFGEGGTGKGEG